MLGEIQIKNLELFTILGVYDFEKQNKRQVLLDIWIKKKYKKPFDDNLENYLNYDLIANFCADFLKTSDYNILEKLTYDLAFALFKKFELFEIKLKIKKTKAIKNSKYVSFKINLKKDDLINK